LQQLLLYTPVSSFAGCLQQLLLTIKLLHMPGSCSSFSLSSFPICRVLAATSPHQRSSQFAGCLQRRLLRCPVSPFAGSLQQLLLTNDLPPLPGPCSSFSFSHGVVTLLTELSSFLVCLVLATTSPTHLLCGLV
jgi:hypothetical protein